LPKKAWQKPHQANLTGTAAAYRPPGDILSVGQRDKATGDYEPWQPG
jgi:NADH:ubiquinone oxidoreductase subunit